MSGSVPKLKLACRKRLRCCDSSQRNIQRNEEEDKGKLQNGDVKVKNMKTSLEVIEKEKEKEKKTPNNNNNSAKKTQVDDYKKGEKCNQMNNCKASAISCREKDMQTEGEGVKIWNDQSYEREKIRKRLKNSNCGRNTHGNGAVREENFVWNCDSKVKDEEVTATSSEKERPTNTNSEKKDQRNGKKYENNIQNGHYMVKSRNVSAAAFEKETKKKLPSSDNFENKIHGAGRNTSVLFIKNKMRSNDGKKMNESITSPVKEKEMRPYESTEMMQHNDKQKKWNVPSDMSKENKTKAPVDSKYKKRKREESSTLFKKVKSMQSDGNHKKIHSTKTKEKNCGNSEGKKRNTPFSFFKVICNNFKESLSIPPTVAPELEALTNHHVYLGDSEGKFTKIRLSVVDGSLAFHKGWNIFVSEHLIKWGEFLLFEYTARSTFSVRIFGRDSRERLHFNIGRKREVVGKKEMHINRSHDDWIPFDSEDDCHFSGEYPRNKKPETHRVTVHTKEDPKSVEHMVGYEPVPIDSRNGKEIIQRCRTHGMSPLHTKEKTVILITDSGSSIHENDVVKPVTSTADSDPQHVAADTNKDTKRVQSGIENGQSDVVCDKEGSLPDVECGTMYTSPKCRENKSASTVQSGDANGPSTVVDDEKGSLPDVECKTKCTSPRCSEKKAASTIQSGIGNGPSDVVGCLPDIECRTKCTSPKYGEEKAALTVQSEIGNGPSAVLDDEKGISPDIECGTKCTSPKCRENKAASVDAASLTHENDDTLKVVKLHGSDEDLRRKQEISSIHLECTTAVNKYTNNGEMSISRDSCRKYEAPAGFRCLEKWMNSIVRDRVVLDGTGLIKHESTQKTDSQFVADYHGLGLKPGDKCFCFEDTDVCSQPIFTMPIKDPLCPDRVSKWKHDGTEINHSIDHKGAVVELRTKMEQLEPVGSNVDGPGDNNPVCTNLVTACSCGAIGQNPVRSGGTGAFVKLQPVVPIKNPSSGGCRTDANADTDGNGTIAELETKTNHLGPMGSIVGQSTSIPVCANNSAARQSGHCFSNHEDRKSIDFFTPVKPVILESDDHSIMKINMQFCVPNTARKWLELPKSLSDAVRRKKQDRNIIILKDPMKRLWPVFYHENSIFVGFTTGWKPFAAANNLQIGDLCELLKEPGDEEAVYSVQIKKK